MHNKKKRKGETNNWSQMINFSQLSAFQYIIKVKVRVIKDDRKIAALRVIVLMQWKALNLPIPELFIMQ